MLGQTSPEKYIKHTLREKMASVRVVCDANFKKSEDVDKSVKKVLKMFSKHFVEKMTPLNEDSDMECVYVYDDLTPEQVRILKKLLNQNKTLLNFKKVMVSNPNEKKKRAQSTKKAWDSDSDNGSVSSKSSASSQSSKNSSNSVSSAASSASSPSTTVSATPSSPESSSSRRSSKSSKRSSKRAKRCTLKYSQIAQRLRDLADEIDNS